MVYLITLVRERGMLKISLIKVLTSILRTKVCRNDPNFFKCLKIRSMNKRYTRDNRLMISESPY